MNEIQFVFKHDRVLREKTLKDTGLSVVLSALFRVLDVFFLVDVLEDELASDEIVIPELDTTLQDHLSALLDGTRAPQMRLVEMPAQSGIERVRGIDVDLGELSEGGRRRRSR